MNPALGFILIVILFGLAFPDWNRSRSYSWEHPMFDNIDGNNPERDAKW